MTKIGETYKSIRSRNCGTIININDSRYRILIRNFTLNEVYERDIDRHAFDEAIIRRTIILTKIVEFNRQLQDLVDEI